MEVNLSSMVNLYRFPLGRACFALARVAQCARDADRKDLASLAEINAMRVEEIIELVARFEQADADLYPPETREVDERLDDSLEGLAGYLASQSRLFSGDERSQAAERLAQIAFPAGVDAVTQSPYAEQHRQVIALLGRLREPDVAADLAMFSEMSDMLERVDALNQEYGRLLALGGEILSREEAKRERARVQEIVCQTLCAVVGHYAMHAPDERAERDRVMGPILEQNEAIREARRHHRNPTDIDHRSGEERSSD